MSSHVETLLNRCRQDSLFIEKWQSTQSFFDEYVRALSLDYAKEFRDNYEEIGRRHTILSDMKADFDKLDVRPVEIVRKKPTRTASRLHNSDFD